MRSRARGIQVLLQAAGIAAAALACGGTAGAQAGRDAGRSSDQVIHGIGARDELAARRAPPPHAEGLIACEGHRASDQSCDAIVTARRLPSPSPRYALEGRGVVGTVAAGRVLLGVSWEEEERDRFRCTVVPPRFALSIEGKPSEKVPNVYRRVAAALAQGLRPPICSFWIAQGDGFVEISYDATGKRFLPGDEPSRPTRFFAGTDASRLRLRQ